MQYSELLKKFFSFTNLKQKDVAKYINYDFSYINKWVNNKNLPTVHQVSSVNNKLANIFTSKIYSLNKVKLFCDEFIDGTSNISKLGMIKIIYTLLNKSYVYSHFKFSKMDPISFFEATYSDEDEIMNATAFAMVYFTQATNIYVNMDINLLNYIVTSDNNLSCYNPSKSTSYHILIDSSEDFKPLKNNIRAYELLHKLGYYDTFIYINETLFSSPFIYIEDCCFISYFLDDSSKPIFATFVTDKNVLNNINSVISKWFNINSLTVSTSRNISSEKFFFQRCLISKEEIYFILSDFNCLFMSEELLLKVMKRLGFSDGEIKDNIDTLRLQNYVLENNDVSIVFNKPYLYTYFLSRKMNLGNSLIQLNASEWAEYIKTLIENIKNKENLKIFTTGSKNIVFTDLKWAYPINISFNSKSVIIKKRIFGSDKFSNYITSSNYALNAVYHNLLNPDTGLRSYTSIDKKLALNYLESMVTVQKLTGKCHINY